jgi:hypothetical protein
MVQLNTSQVVIGKDKQRSATWENIISDALNRNKQGIKYIPIIQKLMVGQFIIMFVKAEHC